MFDVRQGLLGVVEHWHVSGLVFVGYCCVVVVVAVAVLLLLVAFVAGLKRHDFF